MRQRGSSLSQGRGHVWEGLCGEGTAEPRPKDVQGPVQAGVKHGWEAFRGATGRAESQSGDELRVPEAGVERGGGGMRSAPFLRLWRALVSHWILDSNVSLS